MSVKPMAEAAARLQTASKWWLCLQGKPREQELSAWLDWVRADAANLEAFERVEHLAMGLGALDRSQREELLAEFAPPQPKRAWQFWRAKWPIALAASLLAAIAAFYIVPAMQSKPTVAHYATARAEHREMVLADGSRVALGARSDVAVEMRSDQRLVQLESGEAFFEVRKDPQRPFRVRAAGIAVTAVGTAFNVRRTGEHVTVSVAEGTVRLTPVDDSPLRSVLGERPPDVYVDAGERATLDPKRATWTIVKTRRDEALAWQHRMLDFVDEPLGVVIENINRYAAQPIRIEGEGVGELIFTGTVSADHLPQWLAALPAVLPVSIQATPRGEIIARAPSLQATPRAQ